MREGNARLASKVEIEAETSCFLLRRASKRALRSKVYCMKSANVQVLDSPTIYIRAMAGTVYIIKYG